MKLIFLKFIKYYSLQIKLSIASYVFELNDIKIYFLRIHNHTLKKLSNLLFLFSYLIFFPNDLCFKNYFHYHQDHFLPLMNINFHYYYHHFVHPLHLHLHSILIFHILIWLNIFYFRHHFHCYYHHSLHLLLHFCFSLIFLRNLNFFFYQNHFQEKNIYFHFFHSLHPLHTLHNLHTLHPLHPLHLLQYLHFAPFQLNHQSLHYQKNLNLYII